MSTHFRHYKSGEVFGIEYTFDDVGDCLRAHSHGDETAHNIIVLLGAVRFVTKAGERTLRPGDIFDFDGSERHAIIASVPGSVILNLFLNGQPSDYQSLPPSELAGSFDHKEAQLRL